MKHLFNKDTQGNTFWLLPTQNNITRGKSLYEQMVKVTLVKNARVNVDIQIEGQQWVQTYRKHELQPHLIGSEHNAGYHVFTSEQAILDEKVRNKLNGYLGDFGNRERLTAEQARQIIAIINQDKIVIK